MQHRKGRCAAQALACMAKSTLALGDAGWLLMLCNAGMIQAGAVQCGLLANHTDHMQLTGVFACTAVSRYGQGMQLRRCTC